MSSDNVVCRALSSHLRSDSDRRASLIQRVASDLLFLNGWDYRVASSGKVCVSVEIVEPFSSGPMQSPAHSFVPRTVPTSLQPIGSFGFNLTIGLPTLGGAPRPTTSHRQSRGRPAVWVVLHHAGQADDPKIVEVWL